MSQAAGDDRKSNDKRSEGSANGSSEPRTRASARAGAQITVTIDGFRNDRGHALLAVFRDGRHFPGKPEQAERRFEGRIENGRASFVVDDVPAGELALSVLHDEDDDKKLKTNWIGMPKEGLGFSRNPRVRFGPPDFADAKLNVAGDARLNATIHMKYY